MAHFHMWIKLLILSSTAMCYEVPGVRPPKPAASIDAGPIYGILEHTTDSIRPILTFLGIPYAAPPVGKLRFLKPQPVTPWTKTLMTKEFGDHCMQDLAFNDVFQPLRLPHDRMSEDCLYLNVYTPSLISQLPVLVWFHGGGLVFGSGSMYDGTTLATYRELVVVTFNYRLGLLGYMKTDEEHITGDMGFWDQHAVLQWVKRNIAKFGGDPHQVTIAGESSGATSVVLHVLSPASRGLFKRAIPQSYSAVHNKKKCDHLGQSHKAADLLGCGSQEMAETVACMRDKSSEEILQASRHFNFEFEAVEGGDFHPNSSVLLYQQKLYSHVDLLMNVNENEGYMMCGFYGVENVKDLESFQNILTNICKTFFGEDTDRLVKKAMDFYIGDAEQPSPQFLQHQMELLLGHMEIIAPSIQVAKLHAAEVKNTYLYLFKYRASFSTKPDWVIADHADELPFLFSAMTSPLTADDIKSNKDDIYVSRMLTMYIANFIKTGNPNSRGLVEWPRFDEEEKYLIVSRKSSVASKFEEKFMRFWNEEIPVLLGITRSIHDEL